MNRHILLIKCQDTKGLVFKISSILLLHNLNIEQNNEFVDKAQNIFFMRTEISGEVEREKLLAEIKASLQCESEITLCKQEQKSIVIFATKENHCLGDLLIRHNSSDLNAKILAVISNHNHLESLVNKFEIPYHFIDSENIPREQHEEQIIHLCKTLQPDLLVLAKYMRILSAHFVESFPNQIINIHHSFLPAFIGANPYKQAHARGVKVIGATAHFVNNNLDDGPIICQDTIQINHTYTWQDMQKAGRDVEKAVLAKALNLALEERIFLHNNRTVIF
ncbi:formyltetrahydrofolate deformylase [Helicobacter didelphidarum]|uniref:Formyltetrahydrofolate deformylase n=1 Tax=Helicobacter didelphidarum TaxID=2040648 RepID=A0A3D8IKD8_9HELI|nr:formyltetrahydrofolate deformylase [Helicobacter didelphidarum]RDU65817.1 formyltetrahydrofolate deformylase [Helicobacter didelphidarum]